MSELDDVRAAFLAHKTETQRRLDELTNVQNFSWEKYQRIMAEAARVPSLEARIAELTAEVNALKARLGEAGG